VISRSAARVATRTSAAANPAQHRIDGSSESGRALTVAARHRDRHAPWWRSCWRSCLLGSGWSARTAPCRSSARTDHLLPARRSRGCPRAAGTGRREGAGWFIRCSWPGVLHRRPRQPRRGPGLYRPVLLVAAPVETYALLTSSGSHGLWRQSWPPRWPPPLGSSSEPTSSPISLVRVAHRHAFLAFTQLLRHQIAGIVCGLVGRPAIPMTNWLRA